MTRVLYWSDLHWGHQVVADERGFASVDEHDNHLIEKWNATVTKRDSIWILGDLAMSSPDRALEIMRWLPGTKHLILGNHDNAHPMHKNFHSQQARYRDVFKSVSSMGRRRLGGREVVLSHFPYEPDHLGRDDRYAQWRLRDEGRWLIHGHVHDAWTVKGRQLNVGVDRWMNGPAEEGELLAMMEAHEPLQAAA